MTIAQHVIRESHSRTEIQLRRLPRAAIKERRHAFQRVVEPGINKSTLVLVANTQVQRQAAADLPVVLNVISHLPGGRTFFDS